MKRIMGNVDKIIHTIIAVVVAILYFTNVITGTFGIILMVFTVFLLTNLISVGPLYAPFGLNTCKVKEQQ
jgi:hypothetical protein